MTASHLLRSAPRGLALATGALTLLLASACNSGSGGGDQVGTIGEEMAKPDGSGSFFVDENQGGSASKVLLLELSWGRLVDIHDIDELTGDVDPTPVFRDFVINESLQSDGQNFELETNPVTQKTRLIILREKKEDPLADEFLPLLQIAAQDLSPIQPKSDQPGVAPPFSFIARNAALVLRFNDLLKDDETALLALPETVKVLTNYPPTLPFQAKRMLFDPNFGGIAGDEFHSTRVILDLTVSEAEAASITVGAPPLNALGLPASVASTQQANVSVRIPTTGQFSLLTNLSEHVLATTGNGPVDFSAPTVDVVRAMRSGNPDDENNGFLLDLNPPQLVSGWPMTITSASDDPAGDPGFDFVVDMTFTSPCRAQPQPGNILELAGVFAEVSAIAAPPDLSGHVAGVQVRTLSDSPITAQSMLGGGIFQRTYDAGVLPGSLLGCWVSFAPLPGAFPSTDIATNSQVLLRFSEPMDPATVTSFDTFRVQENAADDPTPFELVVGEVGTNGDLKEFTFTPVLPYLHTAGTAEEYNIRLTGENGITDLAGNAPVALPDFIPFTLDPDEVSQTNGGFVLAFDSLDELEPAGEDWRGQFLFDFQRKLIKPRPVARSSAIADRSQAVPGAMTPFAPGVQTPLSPLGSKLMTLWRYVDVGFSSQDEGTFNMDVEGLNWSPIGGQVVSDFYPQFEIRLSHSHYLPDEFLVAGLPDKPKSGLVTTSYNANILSDPLSPQKIVHPKSKPYILNPIDQFVAPTGTRMMPFPLNQGVPPAEAIYYTWRDTAVLAKAGPDGWGIDLKVMEQIGLIPPPPMLGPGEKPPPGLVGWVAGPSQVPSIGLPLLMEFRCYPAEEGIGLNSFDISLAVNSSVVPNFRIFSTGGLDQTGTIVIKNPDLETVPTGGFNPAMGGQPTNWVGDCSFYIGQMDLITRISRIHSIWIDTGQGSSKTDFLDPVIDPAPEAQPFGTELVLAFRGATQITGDSSTKGWAFQADHIDPYGDVRKEDTTVSPTTDEFISSLNQITYVPVGDKTWKDDVDLIDKAQFVQVRVTFVGNTTTLLSSELSGFGLAWDVID